MKPRSRVLAALRRFALAALAFAVVPAHAHDVLVFAAASLKPALDRIIATPEGAAIGVKASYAASSQLARQIEAGAPAAMFISADRDWMDYVELRGLVAAGTRSELLGNALVLVAPKDSTTRLDIIAPGFKLADALGKDGRLALGEPNSVPAGKYAKAALTALGVWDSVAARVVAADNVRAALNFVVRGEAPLAVVYRSDAASEPAVRVVATFPASSHAPIVYPIALVAGHDDAAAHRLLDLLRAPAQQAIFRDLGFDAPPR